MGGVWMNYWREDLADQCEHIRVAIGRRDGVVPKKTVGFRGGMLDHQLGWREKNLPDLAERGYWQGKQYAHIIPADRWTKNLWPGIQDSLPVYLKQNGIHAHTGKHNLLSSWALGASLYFPFGQTDEGRALLAGFLRETVDSRIQAVTDVALEFADDGELATGVLLGEKDGTRGANQTSPDVGVRVDLEGGAKGLILVEVKYCEPDFSSCSARKRELKPHGLGNECDDLARVLGDPGKRCAQHSIYERRYFDHLAGSLEAASEATKLGRCPAAVHGYQLFRQQALAEALARSGQYGLVASCLAYHADNAGLVGCLKGIGLADVGDWGGLFAGKAPFVAFTHQAWAQHVADSTQDRGWRSWLEWVRARYVL